MEVPRGHACSIWTSDSTNRSFVYHSVIISIASGQAWNEPLFCSDRTGNPPMRFLRAESYSASFCFWVNRINMCLYTSQYLAETDFVRCLLSDESVSSVRVCMNNIGSFIHPFNKNGNGSDLNACSWVFHNAGHTATLYYPIIVFLVVTSSGIRLYKWLVQVVKRLYLWSYQTGWALHYPQFMSRNSRSNKKRSSITDTSYSKNPP